MGQAKRRGTYSERVQQATSMNEKLASEVNILKGNHPLKNYLAKMGAQRLRIAMSAMGILRVNKPQNALLDEKASTCNSTSNLPSHGNEERPT